MCAYVINCEKPKEHTRPLPENTRMEWGPGEDLIEAGLEPVSHKDGIVEPEAESFQVLLTMYIGSPNTPIYSQCRHCKKKDLTFFALQSSNLHH